ncbi:M56 family metallopeptidase [Flavitalea flava]
MPAPILYFLKLSISLSLVWLFYQLFLRRLTFYNWNRWFLLGYSLLSFFIPLINIGPVIEKSPFHGLPMIQYLPVFEKGGIPVSLSLNGFFTLRHWNIIIATLALGSLVLLLRLLTRWVSLRKIRSRAILIRQTDMRIYQVNEPILPFSFGNSIYINQKQHTEEEWSTIILHEYVHIRQKHSADILLAELICIVNWYNPFAWLIRYSIRQNLEFIADHKVVEKGLDRKGYQYHLLKVIGESRYKLANNFNFSSLKKRIIMMNRIKSTRLHLVKFLFLFPLLAVLLLAFQDRYEGNAPFPNQILRSDTLPQSSGARPKDAEHQRAEKQPADQHGDGGQNDELRSDGQKGTKTQGNKNKNLSLTGVALRSDTLRRLYIVNGDPMPENWSATSISETDMESVEVVKGDEAIRLFGAKGANGVIAITTKDKNVIHIDVINKVQIKENKDQIKTDKNQIKVLVLNKDENKIGIKSDTLILSDIKKE